MEQYFTPHSLIYLEEEVVEVEPQEEMEEMEHQDAVVVVVEQELPQQEMVVEVETD